MVIQLVGYVLREALLERHFRGGSAYARKRFLAQALLVQTVFELLAECWVPAHFEIRTT